MIAAQEINLDSIEKLILEKKAERTTVYAKRRAEHEAADRRSKIVL